jgi:hypothetical protein
MNRQGILREITNILRDAEHVTVEDIPVYGHTWVNRVVFMFLNVVREFYPIEQFQETLDNIGRELLDAQENI